MLIFIDSHISFSPPIQRNPRPPILTSTIEAALVSWDLRIMGVSIWGCNLLCFLRSTICLLLVMRQPPSPPSMRKLCLKARGGNMNFFIQELRGKASSLGSGAEAIVGCQLDTRCWGWFRQSQIRGFFPLSLISTESRLQIHIITFSGCPGLEILWQYRKPRPSQGSHKMWAKKGRASIDPAHAL